MKALIAMSGGVDSSVAAGLMQEAGFECIGCTMRLFENKDAGLCNSRTCCSARDVEDARIVAGRLGMPYYVFNFTDDFRTQVIDRFVREYLSGRTPNPCIDCNIHLKFARLMRRAEELGCDYIVTGHYARITFDEASGRYQLRKGLDASKDQSYVLYGMTQKQLAHTILPLGEMTKTEVRAKADVWRLINAGKPDSQDICFVPDGDYAKMIRRYTGEDSVPGDFLDLDGNVIGTHKGIIHYTIGQHKRLGQAFGEPRYVCRIDAVANTVTLGDPDDVCADFAKASDFNWISGKAPDSEIRCKVRLRYKQQEQWATVRPVGQESGCDVEIRFDEPQRAITPGQAAVLYDEDIVLGGGTITGGER